MKKKRKKWINKNITLWSKHVRPKETVFNLNSDTYHSEILIESDEINKWICIVENEQKVWNICKSKIKRRLKLYQTKSWIQSEEGKVLKKYKNNWWNDTIINEVKNPFVHVIKRLRIGNSKLKNHRKQGGPGICKNCNLNEPETNEHFFFKCTRFKEQRNRLFKEISNKMKLMKINITIYNLLGYFPAICKSKNNIKKHKNDMLYIYHCVCKFIEDTHRFV